MNSDIIEMLTQPLEYEWSVQGLGFMRTYPLSNGAYHNVTQRVHIWHSSLAVLGATKLHDHPWDFVSEVVFGAVTQTRATPVADESSLDGHPYMRQRILCGEGGGIAGDPEEVRLCSGPIESYYAGQEYSQEAHEIHNSFPANNTVTVLTRTYKEERDHANVFYSKGAKFVSAAPRPASRAEILYITREVLHAYQESS